MDCPQPPGIAVKLPSRLHEAFKHLPVNCHGRTELQRRQEHQKPQQILHPQPSNGLRSSWFSRVAWIFSIFSLMVLPIIPNAPIVKTAANVVTKIDSRAAPPC